MLAVAARARLDVTGIALSTLCLIHCLAVPLIAAGAFAWVVSESVHVVLSIALSTVVLAVVVPGYKRHRKAAAPILLVSGVALVVGAVLLGEAIGEVGETALTIVGSAALVLGHVLNIRFPNCTCAACTPEP